MTTAEPERLMDRHWSTVEIRSLPRATLEQIMDNLLKARGKVSLSNVLAVDFPFMLFTLPRELCIPSKCGHAQL